MNILNRALTQSCCPVQGSNLQPWCYQHDAITNWANQEEQRKGRNYSMTESTLAVSNLVKELNGGHFAKTVVMQGSKVLCICAASPESHNEAISMDFVFCHQRCSSGGNTGRFSYQKIIHLTKNKHTGSRTWKQAGCNIHKHILYVSTPAHTGTQTHTHRHRRVKQTGRWWRVFWMDTCHILRKWNTVTSDLHGGSVACVGSDQMKNVRHFIITQQ